MIKWQKREDKSPVFKLMCRLENDLQREYEKTGGESFTFTLILMDLEKVYNMISTVYSHEKEEV